jgi:hypothetical protein
MGATIMRIEPRRQPNDCAVWSLRTYLDIPYERVLQVVKQLDRSKGKNGLHTATIIRVAKELGRPLRKVPPSQIDEDSYGVLMVQHPESGHAAVLCKSLVFDVNSLVWLDLTLWLQHEKYTIECLLTED